MQLYNAALKKVPPEKTKFGESKSTLPVESPVTYSLVTSFFFF